MKQNRNDQVHSPKELLQRIANAYQKLWVPASTQPATTKKIWARVGIYLMMTEEEFELLQNEEEYAEAEALVRGKLMNREYEISGETYFPGQMEESKGEWFHEYDINFDL